MAIFRKKNKETMAAPPEEEETDEEIDEIEKMASAPKITMPKIPKKIPVQERKELEYREVPVCLSQEQINNLVIENNIMLKQIIADMD